MLIGQGPGKKNYYVLYPEGFRSEPMNKRIAKDYAEIFDGKVKVIKRNIIIRWLKGVLNGSLS